MRILYSFAGNEFQPVLYQVSTAALSLGDIAQPKCSILRSLQNTHVLLLISFRNRCKGMIEWMWYYVSFQPGARLITASYKATPVVGTKLDVDLKDS